MKKILSTALIAIVLSMFTIDTINAARAAGAGAAEDTATMGAERRGTRRAARRATRRGRRGRRPTRRASRSVAKVQDTADTLQKTAAIIRTASTPEEKAEAIKTANELAQELLASIQDERTWTKDLGISKYTPEQVANATAKLAELEARKVALENDIKEKEDYLKRISARSWVFWTKVREGEKQEDLDNARKDLADMRTTLKNINKKIRDQAVIAGAEYSSTIRGAITALTAATLAGAAYGIDSYFELGYAKAAGTAMDEVYKNIKEKGIFEVGKGAFSDFYNSVSTAISDIKEGTGSRATAAMNWVYNKVYGSKEETPKPVEETLKKIQNNETKGNDTKVDEELDKLKEQVQNNPPAGGAGQQ